jgi:hypothetical protein
MLVGWWGDQGAMMLQGMIISMYLPQRMLAGWGNQDAMVMMPEMLSENLRFRRMWH